MFRMLLDPRLLIPPAAGSTGSEFTDFWERLLSWASDGRVGIGESCLTYVCDYYAIFGYPTSVLEDVHGRPVRREYHRALTQLLTRVFDHRTRPGRRRMDPTYLGSAEESEHLEFDVSGTVGHEVVGIATRFEHWISPADIVRFDPPPPEWLHLCMSALAELAAERAAAVEQYYSGRRIFIVGGRPDDRILSEICAATGVELDRISWIASEKGKPARNIDERWSGLRDGVDVSICITGRIGHAQSEMARRAALSRGSIHLLAERPGDIVSSLRMLAAGSPPDMDGNPASL